MKKGRKTKILLLSFFVLIVAVGGYLLYEFKFKQYDVADGEVEKIVEDPYIVELPDGSKITFDSEGNVSELGKGEGENLIEAESGDTSAQNSNATKLTSSAASEETGDTKNISNPQTPTKAGKNNEQEVTVASIKQKYVPIFSELESQADKKISALVGHAKKEYQDKKASGESIEFGYFYNKYMSSANSLEKSTDTVFYGVLTMLENDLVKNGFDKSYAQSFKEEYEEKKKARREGILTKALGN